MRRKLNIVFKKISHCLLITCPLILILFVSNIFIICYYYLTHTAQILVHEKTKYLFLKLLLWVLFGPFILPVLVLVDNYNVLVVISDYDYEERQSLILLEEELKWNYISQAKEKLSNIKSDNKKRYPYTHLIYQMIDFQPENEKEDNLEADHDKQELGQKEKIKVDFYKEILRGFSLQNNEYVNIEFLEEFLNKNLR